MNFFGHAVIAGEYSAEPEFILGSMLPDFLSMLRIPQPRVCSEQLLDGVAFHHRTDAAFHNSLVFSDLQRRSFAELTTLGVRRGPARGAAHVGIELLIDTALAEALHATPPKHNLKVTWSLYEAALHAAASSPASTTRLFGDDVGRIAGLCKGLAQLGSGRFDGGPQAAVVILRRAVSGRPRLELSTEEIRIAGQWAPRVFPTVKSQLDNLLSQLKKTLGG